MRKKTFGVDNDWYAKAASLPMAFGRKFHAMVGHKNIALRDLWSKGVEAIGAWRQALSFVRML